MKEKEAREKAERQGIKSVADAMGFSRTNRAYEEQLKRVRTNPETGRAEYIPTPEEQARVERAGRRMRELDGREGRRAMPPRPVVRAPGAKSPTGGSFVKSSSDELELLRKAEDLASSGKGGPSAAILASILKAARGGTE